MPAVLIVAADNQRIVARSLADAGWAVNLGPAAGLEPGSVAAALTRLMLDPLRRKRQSEAGRELIDGAWHGIAGPVERWSDDTVT